MKDKPMTSLKDQIAAFKKKIESRDPANDWKPNCETCYDKKYVEVGGVTSKCPDCVLNTFDGAPSTPHEFRKAVMANYEPLPGNSHAIRAGLNWLDRANGDLFLHGGVGSGKTRLACSVLNDWYRRTRTGMFTRVSGMLFSLQPKEDNSHERFWFRVVESRVLVLDDIGAEREDASDFTRRMLLQLYEERGDRGFRTILTSNKSLQELSEQLADERLVSRIAGRAEIVKLTTADQRLKRR